MEAGQLWFWETGGFSSPKDCPMLGTVSYSPSKILKGSEITDPVLSKFDFYDDDYTIKKLIDLGFNLVLVSNPNNDEEISVNGPSLVKAIKAHELDGVTIDDVSWDIEYISFDAHLIPPEGDTSKFAKSYELSKVAREYALKYAIEKYLEDNPDDDACAASLECRIELLKKELNKMQQDFAKVTRTKTTRTKRR